MFSEILKIIPKMDEKDLKKMQNELQGRFTKIAKGFGKGLASVIKGGGIAGIGLALIDKVLNPLKDVQEAIDKTLKSSDDVTTNAKQFDTTSGRLLKLIALGKSAGLDQDNLFVLMTKFQTAVAEAKANPNQPSSVKNFTDEKDTAVAFFDFIQALQKMDKNQQLLVQQSVFGEKQILKMADFIQTDFPKAVEELGLNKITADSLTKSNDKLAGLNDQQDTLTAKRELGDVITKGNTITEAMIRARDAQEKLGLEKENKRIQSYENLAALSMTAERITGLVEQGVGLLGQLINTALPKFNQFITTFEKIGKSSIFKSWFGKGE
jgi:hypothetical protein